MICLVKVLLLSLLLAPFPPESVATLVRDSIPESSGEVWVASDCLCPLDYVEQQLPTQCGQHNTLLYWLLYLRGGTLKMVSYEAPNGMGHTLVEFNGAEYDSFLDNEAWRENTTGKRYIAPSPILLLFGGCSQYNSTGVHK